MKFVRKLLFSVFIVLTLLPLPQVYAQSRSEQIDTFVSNISVSDKNVATITETIEYNFGSLDRHGIKRFIPIKTKAGQSGKNYYYDFKFLEATQDGHSVETKISNEGDHKVIRLGNPNQTITGIHSYTISYQMSPVIERDGEANYFNWNITGNDWEVPIMSVNANIQFPSGESIQATRCYAGPNGSTAENCTPRINQNNMTITAGPISTEAGVTINALSSGTTYSTYLAPGDIPTYQWLPALGFIVGLGAIIVGLLSRLASHLLYKYRRGRELVIPQYESPDGLTPGEVGLLNDHRADMVEITATLVDLAVRGYLRIDQSKPKTIFKRAEYTFHAGKSYASGTKAYERSLLEMIFGGKKTVSLKSISATKAAPVISSIKQTLKSNLQRKGYYATKRKGGFLRALRKFFIWIIILSVIAANLYSWSKGVEFGLTFFSGLVMFVGLLVGWGISQRVELSQSGYRQWAKVAGLKLFLSVTEKERLKFHDAPDKNPKLFNKLLPYAIALGVEKEWAKQFEGMDLQKESSWYSSHYPFTAIVLADSMSHDLSRSVSSNFTPTQSSGGFSSGGSSGGGGGGGGGGSW